MAQGQDSEASEAAERYARAAFDLAKDANALDALESDFAKFGQAWADNEELRAAARSPLIDPNEKARALVAVAEKLGASELGRNVIGVVAVNRRARELPGVFSAFRTLLARERGSRQVEIVSAKPLSDAEKKSITDQLGQTLGVKVDAETRVDESLIGGFVVRVGSRQFDASVKSKLDALRLSLKSA